MYKLVDKKDLAENLTLYEIEAPRVAKARKPGQFVMVRAFDHSERIPLTIADINKDKGTITIIVQAVGKSTAEMMDLHKGDFFQDIAGPMGEPSHLDKYGTVVTIGGGLGTAVVYPQAIALKELGNKVISIIGARSKHLIILEEQMAQCSDEVIVTTDDGTYGRKGLVTHVLQEMIENPQTKVDAVYAAGPVIMMKAVSEVTRPHNIPTIVSLNPIMVDGTGMCGGCRVTIGGETKFACVDGPEFDGHLVDFDELLDRLQTYRLQEQYSYVNYQVECKCKAHL